MDRLQEMQSFCAVVDAGSFVNAAEALGVSKASVSRYVANLEARLGVRLLHRTTRKLSLTEEGSVFNTRCRELLSGIEEAEAEITAHSGSAQGLLRVSVPVTFGVQHLAPLWESFHVRYPKIRLEVTLSDRIADVVEEGYDLAIRITRLASSSLISKRLAGTRVVLCASPGYLASHGVPAHPAELANHEIIAYSYWSPTDTWHFDGPDGPVSVAIKPWIHTNNGDTCRAIALSHQGVILQPTFLIGDDLAAGRLVELLPEYRSIELGVYAVYPTRKHVAPKVRALVDFLAQRLTALR